MMTAIYMKLMDTCVIAETNHNLSSIDIDMIDYLVRFENL